MICGLYAERDRPRNRAPLDAKESYRIVEAGRLNDQRRKAVEAMDYSGKLAEDWLQFLQPRVNGGGVFECQVG
jgi:hypothetical protein